MRKTWTLLILIVIVITVASAQTEFMDHGGSTALQKGHFQVNLGSGYTNWGVPIYGGVDYAFNEDITLGGFVSYSSYSENWFNASWKHEVLSAFGSINMHVNRLLQFDEDVDLYGGISLGFSSFSTKASDNSNPALTYSGDKNSGLLFAIQAGGRYYFTDNLGAIGEVLVGNMVGLRVGLTYRIQ